METNKNLETAATEPDRTLSTIEDVLRKRLGETLISVDASEYFIQIGGVGWDVQVVLDAEGELPDELRVDEVERRAVVEQWIEQDSPSVGDALYDFTIDVLLEDEMNAEDDYYL